MESLVQSSSKKNKSQIKATSSSSTDGCLICRVTKAYNDYPDLLYWLRSNDYSSEEKEAISKLLTGVKADQELLDFLEALQPDE
jgi:hypothetical protein